MKKNAEKVISVLIVLLLSPVILFGLLLAAFCWLWDRLKEPSRKRAYESSRYYADFRAPYRENITREESYLFYNEAVERLFPVKMIHPANGAADYLIADGSIYLFPMSQDVFGGISYNVTEKLWEVDFDGDLFPLEEEWEKYKRSVFDSEQDLPCYLLLKQCYLNPSHSKEEAFNDNYAADLLPQYVRVVQQYTDIIPE